MRSPLWSRRTADSARLICLRMHVLWYGCRSIAVCRHAAIGHLSFEKGQASFDVHVGRIEFCSSGVGVKRIASLVVARFVL
jgi:hypothetical protein